MKRILSLVGIAALVALVGLAAVSAVAFAQAGDDGTAWPNNLRERIHEAVAELLGIPVDEYNTAVDQAHEQVLKEGVDEGWLTQEQAERMQEQMADGYGPNMIGPGAMGSNRGGMGGPQGGKFNTMPGRGSMMNGSQISPFDVAAEVLGMPVNDLLTELQGGKTLAEVAADKGVDPQTIVDAFLSQHNDWLAEAVADGRLTQAQADDMQERAKSMIDTMLNQAMPFGGRGGARGGYGLDGNRPNIDSGNQNDA